MARNSTRFYSLDLARGLCLVLMTIDHLPGNIVSRFSNTNFGPFGFFTAASVFVFISGVVSALTYGSTLSELGVGAAWARALRRAGQLYAVNTAVYLLLLAGVTAGLLRSQVWHGEFPLFFEDPWAALWRGLVLLYRPGFLDILPMYVLFLLCVVPVLTAVRAGWSSAVVSLSVLVWCGAQLQTHNTFALNPLGYQLLFVTGLVIGARANGSPLRFSPAVERLLLIAAGPAVVLFLARFALGVLRSADSILPPESWISHLENNGPLRVINFALVAFLATRAWPLWSDRIQRDKVVAGWINSLGQHSLPVFAWSILITYASMALMPEQPSKLWRLMDVVLTLSSLTIPAFVDRRWRQHASRVKQAPGAAEGAGAYRRIRP